MNLDETLKGCVIAGPDMFLQIKNLSQSMLLKIKMEKKLVECG